MHTLKLSTDNGQWTAYRIVVSDRFERTAQTDHEDRTTDHSVIGAVAGGVDVFKYAGKKEVIETSDLDNLLLSINGSAPTPAREFPVAREADFSEEFGRSGASSGKSPSGGGSSVGQAQAPDPIDHPDPPEQADLPAPAEGDDAIGGGLWHPAGDENPGWGLVGRHEQTTRDVTIHVDPDDNGGVQAAFNRLPREIYHDVVIDLPAGTFDGNGSSVRTGRIYVHSCGDLVVRGAGHGRTRVTSGINAMTTSSKESHLTLKEIHFDGLSQFAGPVDLRDCRFSGFERAGANSTGTAAISGKNGQIHAKRCVVGDPGDDYGLWSTIQERVVLIDCEIRGRVAAINKAPGCDYTLVGCEIRAPRKFA